MRMLKKPMSILLSLLMIVSLFTIVPFPVGAESAVLRSKPRSAAASQREQVIPFSRVRRSA